MSHSSASPHEPAPEPAAATEEDTAALANLGKIRDILFGAQVRDTETKLVQLEERIRRDNEHTQRRLDEIEKLIHASVESLGERLKSLRSETSAALGGASNEARAAATGLRQAVGALDDRVERERKEIRQALDEAVERLRDDIRRRHDDALAALAQQGQRLQAGKVDRVALGELLADLSARVSR